MKNALALLFFFAFLLAFGAFNGVAWLASVSVGFLGSSLIIVASFYGYYKRVRQKLERGEIEADKFNDEDDDSEVLEREEDIKSFIATQKQKRKLLPSAHSFGSSFLPLRILSYAIFVIAFFMLKRHDLLEFAALFIGVGIGAFGAIITARRFYG
ncbi:hypothetical protein [Campylobacter sp. 19-13652]|uniref:hypothetical protein n=1 Tax=Campylobacter sp. 19-13652 TaxID=2840180 RepID=UPI001C770022|nr:hypothetical protein [Campylobacter sp. 19-13652]BCX79110.1 hypothetical protein LBC_05720 [Campylobacter sp. 19-13652]